MAKTDERAPRTPSGFGPGFMAPLMIAAALNPFNSTSLAVALTPIGRQFDDLAGTAWLLAAVYLSAAIAQPVMGRIADLFGPRRTLFAGMTIVALGGLIGACAPNMAVLIASRLIIGVGTSAGYPCGLAMIRAQAAALDVAPPARALAFLSVAANISGTIGPPFGGFILAMLGWRWLFLINLPLAVIGLLAMRTLPADPPPRRFDLGAIDLPGMILFGIGITALMLFLMDLSTHFDPWRLGIAVLFLTALFIFERRQARPFVDVRMLGRNGTLPLIYLRQVLTSAMMYSLFYAAPQWMQASRGLPPAEVGVLMLPYALSAAVATFIVSRPTWAPARPAINIVSLVAVGVGVFLLDSSLPISAVVVLLGFCGLASGSQGMWHQQGLMRHAPPDQMGAAAGLLRTAQYIGAMLAAMMIALVMHRGADDGSMRMLAFIFAPMILLMLALVVIDRKALARD